MPNKTKEQLLETKRKWREANKEKIRLQRKKHYEKHCNSLS